MTNAVNGHAVSRLHADFLEEYSSEESTLKYTRKTAGYGISHLLDHEYAKIYLESIKSYIPKSRLSAGIRIWEFGCGGGMNLLHLVSLLRREGISVDLACGTDFSKSLITAAGEEISHYRRAIQIDKVKFTVASNEDLVEQGARGLGVARDELIGSFDLVFGVNTIRYNHRLGNVDRCVGSIRQLLKQGAICIVIDMNCKFPAFRSRLREWRSKQDEHSIFLPSLDEYAQPFSAAGFEILKKRNFCWIPHSAGRQLTGVMRALTPVLNSVAPSRGMRSLVISRKDSCGAR